MLFPSSVIVIIIIIVVVFLRYYHFRQCYCCHHRVFSRVPRAWRLAGTRVGRRQFFRVAGRGDGGRLGAMSSSCRRRRRRPSDQFDQVRTVGGRRVRTSACPKPCGV